MQIDIPVCTPGLSEKTQIALYIIGSLQAVLLAYFGVQQRRSGNAQNETKKAVDETKGVVHETKASVDSAKESIQAQNTGIRKLTQLTVAVEAARQLGQEPPSMAGTMGVDVDKEVKILQKRIAALHTLEAEQDLKRRGDEAFEKLERDAGLKNNNT